MVTGRVLSRAEAAGFEGEGEGVDVADAGDEEGQREAEDHADFAKGVGGIGTVAATGFGLEDFAHTLAEGGDEAQGGDEDAGVGGRSRRCRHEGDDLGGGSEGTTREMTPTGGDQRRE